MKKTLAATTIFLGSFLIFGIQPMVGRTLLPAFGGTAAVWVVCLCAFQVFLLGGYFLAHKAFGNFETDGGKTFKSRLKWYIATLVVCATWTIVVAFCRGSLLSISGLLDFPAVSVLVCVLVLVGLPYMLLSANSSLVQVLAGGNYRLYAVGNAGSLLGLLAYPFLFEPHVALTAQWLGFAVGMLVYAALLYRLSSIPTDASRSDPRDDVQSKPCNQENGETSGFVPLLWFVLPAISCFLLDSLTTHITLDVMPMPLIWTGTLSLFLLSYIIGFSGFAMKLVRPFAIVTICAFAGLCWMNGKPLASVGLPTAMSLYGLFLFAACTYLHSWLYAVRPDSGRLTKYYLFQSLGGAVGGIVASLAFPMLTDSIVEYPIAIFLIAAVVVAGLFLYARSALSFVFPALAVAVAVFGGWKYHEGSKVETRPSVYKGRGFFGTIEVLEAKAKTQRGEGVIHEFVHGTTVHGIQALIPGMERMPTTYYTPNASGFAICGHPKYRNGEPMRVNITGLGVGVLFCYGRTNDYYRAYEISKDALDVATNTNLFTFVSDCPATKDLVLGDARKGLEAELAAGVEPYDVIVVDAFTGDNLPYHLSTKEAFELYFKLLKPDGILCVNISNWHLQLEPFMRKIGETFNVPLLGVRTGNNYGQLQFGACIAFFCPQPDKIAPPEIGKPNLKWGDGVFVDFSKFKSMREMPTDEKGSFIDLIKW